MTLFARLAVLGALLVSVGGCGSGAHDAPSAPTNAAPVAAATSIYECPDGDTSAECMDATPLGGQPTDPGVIAANCPEACQALKDSLGLSGAALPGAALAFQVDWDWLYDAVKIRCEDGDIWWKANHDCWDCKEGCAGDACPAGARCKTIRTQSGSDCQAYMCDAAQGWGYLETSHQAIPVCKRKKTASFGAPVVNASTVNSNVSLQWNAVSGASGYRIYRQLDWQSAPEVWYTKTTETNYGDGSTQVTGDPLTAPPAGEWVSYFVVSLDANDVESGPSTTYYWSRGGLAPY